ncbi:MAG: ABC transporter permease [Endomicrobiia bacterium]
MNLLLGFLYKELKILFSYKFHSLLKLFSLIFQIVIFYYLCSLISEEYFKFLFLGLLFSRIIYYVLSSLIESIKQEQYWGSFNLLLMLPYKEIKLFFIIFLSKILFLFLEITLYFLISTFLSLKINFLQILFVYVYTIFTISISLGYTFLICSLSIFIKKSESIGWLLSALLDLLSGVYFKTELLPQPLYSISKILPTTYMLNFLRESLLHNKYNFSILVYPTLVGILFLPFSIIVLNKVILKTLVRGDLSSY